MNVLVSVLLSLFSFIIICGGTNQFLFITDVSIKKYDAKITNTSKTITNEPIKYITDMGYDFELQTVYYVVNSKSLYSLSMITKENKFLMTSKNGIQHIAVDWVTKKIYYSVSMRNRLAVVKNDGSNRKVLFQRKLANLRGICVSPRNGFLFFSDVGDDVKIERANMDGTDNQVLVYTNLRMPVTLTVDPVENLIYWADVLKETVEVINMDGTGRRTLLSIPNVLWGAVSSIAIFKSQVFISSTGSFGFRNELPPKIFSCNRTSTILMNCSIALSGSKFYSSVRPYGINTQKITNSNCRYRNGGCSHLCFLTPKRRYSCGCPTGYKLLEDQKTCTIAFKKFLLFATRKDLRIVSLDVDNKVDVIIPVNIDDKNKVTGVDYDPVEKMIYWTESEGNEYGVIKRSYLNGSVVEEIVPQGYTQPDHLAIDWVARNIYWTCPLFKKIYISKLNGSSNMVVIDEGLGEPRGIAVDPGDGRIYWSDWGKKNPKIESSNLDGTGREILVNGSLLWPNGVTIDYHRRHLYWVDAGLDSIEYYDLTKKTRHKILNRSPHAFGVSVLGDMLYWTDWQQRSLFQFNLVDRKKWEKTIYNVPDIMGLRAVDTNLKYGYNECGKNNFGCSHFCFHKPNHGARCVCPPGYYIDLKEKYCTALPGYLLYATHRSINMLSITTSKISASSKITGNDIAHIATLSKMKRVFWVQDSGGSASTAIRSASLNQTKFQKIIQTGFTGHIGGIAIDWLSHNIYWSQKKLQRIEVSRLDGSFKRVLVNKSGGDIDKVEVDPIKGKLYWLQSKNIKNNTVYNLMRSELDGGSPFILVNFTEEPFGLTVDVNDSRIYWITEKYIGSISHLGTLKRFLKVAFLQPYGMVLFRNHLFTCELETPQHVASIHKVTGKRKNIPLDQNWCVDISVFHTGLQQGDNLCSENNGGCEHLCFPMNLTHRKCECESHYKLDSTTNTTCIGPESFLLISQKDNAFRYLPSAGTNVALNLKSSDLDVAMVRYNIMTNTVYWLNKDSIEKTWIISYMLNNEVRVLDLCKANGIPTSFTIDFLSNTLYWTDESDFSISFLRLDPTVNRTSSSKCGVIYKNKKFRPTKIVSIPEKGVLVFVNEKGENSNTLESIRMNGDNQQQLYDFKDDSTYDIAIDASNKNAFRIYWLHLTKIESVTLEGTNKQEFFLFNTEMFKPLAITVLDGNVYWIDKKQQGNQAEFLKWRSLKKDERSIYSETWAYENTRDLESIQMNRVQRDHPCNIDNGGCSHICYNSPTQSFSESAESSCGCPRGFGFKADDKSDQTCEEQNNSTCAYICKGLCKPLGCPCKELLECLEGDDVQCYGCKDEQFLCLQGPTRPCLIDRKKYCDGNIDCFNSSDEDPIKCKNYPGPSVPTAPSEEPTKFVAVHAAHSYSEYTAGIVSGSILTAFVFVCVFYVVCRLHQKKAAANSKNVNKSLLRETASFKVASPNTKESVFVLSPKRTDNDSAAITDSFLSSSDLSRLPRHNKDIIPLNYGMRYITGSSTNVTDSTSPMPFNPPPTIASSTSVASLSSLHEYSQEHDDIMSEISDLTIDYLPAPPATPLYCPSDVESVLTTDLESVSGLSSSKRSCRQCVQHQTPSYDRHGRPYSHLCCCEDSATASTLSTYSKSLDRRLPPCSNCSYCSSKTDSYHSMGRHKIPPASYHTPSLVSGGESDYSSSTLPRHLQHGSSRPLVPSLASGISSCSSETSIITVRQKDDQSPYDSSSEASSNFYNTYGPPPSPGADFPPDMNNFEDFKDEEDEALENNLLLESHRPRSGMVD